MNSEVQMLEAIKLSTLVMSGVSSQQITKTQDRDASEVVKRIPGISVIDNKFIITRGLSQRYNNVWINNNAVPSRNFAKYRLRATMILSCSASYRVILN